MVSHRCAPGAAEEIENSHAETIAQYPQDAANFWYNLEGLRFEDYTRRQRAQLMLKDMEKYMSLLGRDELYLLLDGLAKTDAYQPEAVVEESWRTLLREQQKS